MYYTLHKRRKPSDILVTIEEFNKPEQTVLFDFFDSNEYNGFNEFLGNERLLGKPSMVLLKNYKLRNVREGAIYAIKSETIARWRNENLISQQQDSFLIGYSIELPKSEENIFTSSVSLNERYDFWLNYLMPGHWDLKDILHPTGGELSVTVRNVGQGNWNEINVNGEVKLVYDAGAPIHASRTEVEQIIGNRNTMYSKSKPILFLSHWDKDHYHSLIGMTDAELSNFSSFVCRDYAPNITSRILFSRISYAVGARNIYTIPAEQRFQWGGPTYLIPITSIRRQIVLYNAQRHWNRNVSGMALSIKTKKSSAVLTGDHHYEQISRDILPNLNYHHKHNLVVPHHGGNAGFYIYNRPPQASCAEAVISVGPNHYGHPTRINLDSLRDSGFTTTRTDINGADYIIHL